MLTKQLYRWSFPILIIDKLGLNDINKNTIETKQHIGKHIMSVKYNFSLIENFKIQHNVQNLPKLINCRIDLLLNMSATFESESKSYINLF